MLRKPLALENVLQAALSLVNGLDPFLCFGESALQGALEWF
jgi:hypothetical protein